MAQFWRGILSVLTVLMMTSMAGAADRAIIVLDASGSMWGQIDGRPKLEIARETLKSVLPTLPEGLELGLMAYGHREKGSCEDIELVVPPARANSGAISAAADAMKFLGRTPLSAAVRQAAENLKYTEDKATVILVTDGLETCSADPCAVGAELEQAGIDFTAHVVGFGLTAEEGREVACLAENTGGRYIQASDEAGLKEALVAAVTIETVPEVQPEPVAPEPEPEPARPEFNFMPSLMLGEGGAVLEDAGQSWVIHEANQDGSRGDYVTTEYNRYKGSLEAGDYVVTAKLGQAEAEQMVAIDEDEPAAPVFVLDAGTLVIHPRPSEGADVADAAHVVIEFPGASRVATFYGDTSEVVPAGEMKVTVKIGTGEVSETIRIAAGETVEKDIVVGVGRVVANAVYTAGGDKVEATGVAFNIVRAAKKIDGSRQDVATTFGPDSTFDLPTGDYVLIARLEEASVEQPFNIRAGETKEVEAVLGAGVLAVSAPGFSEIAVFAARKDIQGNRKPFGFAYSDTHQVTLPAGDYAVIAKRPGNAGSKEMAATVRAGERTELTLE